jgi:lysophospholipase L1-like esterase
MRQLPCFVIGAALVTAAAGGLVALPASGARPHRPHGLHRPGSRTLLVVGDSLTVGTRPYLHHWLGRWHIHTEASVSKQVTEGPPTLRRYGRRLPRVIFVNLGTNGDPRAVSLFRSAVRRTMRIAGPDRCVVWSSIVRPPVAGRSYRDLNRALADEAIERPNLMLFRWVRMARKHPGWFGPDHVHVTASAYNVRARAMARTVRSCRKQTLR